MSSEFGTRVRERAAGAGYRAYLALAVVVLLVGLFAALLVAPESTTGRFAAVLFARTTLASALRLSVPIAFAALGGIFAEKSGVINIGLEGLLIISAFAGVYTTYLAGTAWLPPEFAWLSVWVGLFGGIVASTLLALLFAVVCIEFRADQIIAGLAVWLIALGLAPFASQVVFGSTNSENVATFSTLAQMGIPGLSEFVVTEFAFLGGYSLATLPFVGALFNATPIVYLMFVAVAASWWTLNHTAFGRHVRASGENPKALDTAGVNVSHVRYAAVVLSGVLCGVGGAALSLSLGQFIGNGPTMVNGKGFIAIVAYLFGNYNPIGALLSTLLFAGLDALQLVLQARAVVDVPDPLVRTIPYVTVIVVLALFGRTRTPEAAGDHYESGEE